MAEQSVVTYTRKMTKEFTREMTQQLAVKHFFRELFSENLESLNKDVLEKSMKKALKKFESLSAKEQAKAVEEGARLAQQFIDKEGVIDFVKIIGSSLADPTA